MDACWQRVANPDTTDPAAPTVTPPLRRKSNANICLRLEYGGGTARAKDSLGRRRHEKRQGPSGRQGWQDERVAAVAANLSAGFLCGADGPVARGARVGSSGREPSRVDSILHPTAARAERHSIENRGDWSGPSAHADRKARKSPSTTLPTEKGQTVRKPASQSPGLQPRKGYGRRVAEVGGKPPVHPRTKQREGRTP